MSLQGSAIVISLFCKQLTQLLPSPAQAAQHGGRANLEFLRHGVCPFAVEVVQHNSLAVLLIKPPQGTLERCVIALWLRSVAIATERLDCIPANSSAPQEIDTEVPRDPPDPRAEAVALAEPADLQEAFYHRFLGKVLGIGGIAGRAKAYGEDITDMAFYQFAVCALITRSAPNNQLFFTENVQSGAPIFRSTTLTISPWIFCQKFAGLESFFHRNHPFLARAVDTARISALGCVHWTGDH
jgi:hypothetical protein